MRFFSRIISLFRRRRLDADMAEEMRFHLRQSAEERVADGAAAEEAHRAAKRAFGGMDQIKELAREERGWVWLEQIGQDLHFAWRSLRWNPRFTGLALLTLALAIGATTAIFCIADAVWFRPLPYASAGELQTILMLNRKTGQRSTLVTYDVLRAIAQEKPGIVGVAYGGSIPGPIVDLNQVAEQLPAAEVTANYFELLGVRAASGRLFGDGDAAAAGRPAVLAFATWKNRFGGDPLVVGHPVTLGSKTYDVIGVLPENFVFTSTFIGKPEIVTIAAPMPTGGPPNQGEFNPVVRRAVGVSREEEQERIAALVRAAGVRPEVKAGDLAPVLEDLGTVLFPVGRPVMGLLLGASGIVVLIGCANLGQMMRVKQRRRSHETAVRAALGASRLRLARPVVFEGAFLGCAGAALALLFTQLTLGVLLGQVPAAAIRNASAVGVDHRVILFALTLGILSGLVVALAPAWADARSSFRSPPPKARTRGRFGNVNIAMQVALAVVLVFGTVSVTRSFLATLGVPLGFSPEGVLVINLLPPDGDGATRQEFYFRALEVLGRRRDVRSAGAAGSLPLSGNGPAESVRPGVAVGKPVAIYHALPGYFETIGVRLVRGRLPTAGEIRGGANFAVLSETAAQSLFPDRDPLGAMVANEKGDRQFIVVGVVADVLDSFDQSLPAPIYVPPGSATRRLALVARTSSPDYQAFLEIRLELGAINPGRPVTVEWWPDRISGLTVFRNPRFQTLVLGTFSSLAVILVAVGIFAIVGFLVAIREREFGIRLAIGATPAALTGLVLRQTLGPVVVGLAAGLVATHWTARLVEVYLKQSGAGDTLTFGVTVTVILVAAVLAAYLPARRAAAVDPIIALRAE